ncbi:MAG: GntR family transcriptional regulator [Planctomycetes bacterium]|nr:GntR family transcriptional regulator [Planctomycetota bacterium]
MESTLHIYESIVRDIKEKISNGEIRLGSRLPPIRDLSVHYDCNYHTIRRAMKSLTEEGIVESKKGSGTYVREQKKSVIGAGGSFSVILPSIKNPYTIRLCQALQTEALNLDCMLDWQFVPSLASLLDTPKQLERISGDVLVLPWFKETDEELRALDALEKEIDLPLVIPINRKNGDLAGFKDDDFEGMDSKVAARMAADLFTRSGSEGLIFAAYQDEAVGNIELSYRLDSFQQYCMEQDLRSFVCFYDPQKPNLNNCLKFIEKYKGKLGMVCFHDDIAKAMYPELSAKGIVIGQDVGIIGFNNMDFTSSLNPPLSSMSISFEDLAKAMLAHATARKHGGVKFLQENLRMQYHLRDSCGCKSKLGEQEAQDLVDQIFVNQ